MPSLLGQYSFKQSTKTFAVGTSNSGSTGVQVTNIQGTTNFAGSGCNQYYIVNASNGYCFFTLDKASATVAAIPADSSSGQGYMLPPASGGTFSGPENAYFSAVLDTGTGHAYVCGGEGL